MGRRDGCMLALIMGVNWGLDLRAWPGEIIVMIIDLHIAHHYISMEDSFTTEG